MEIIQPRTKSNLNVVIYPNKKDFLDWGKKVHLWYFSSKMKSWLSNNNNNTYQTFQVTSTACFTAKGSYQSGPKPAAFLACTLKGGLSGPLKYFLTVAWKVWITASWWTSVSSEFKFSEFSCEFFTSSESPIMLLICCCLTVSSSALGLSEETSGANALFGHEADDRRQRYLNHLTPAAQWVISSG